MDRNTQPLKFADRFRARRAPPCERLESRLLFAVTVTGTVTLDESRRPADRRRRRHRRGQQRQRRRARHAAGQVPSLSNRLFGGGGPGAQLHLRRPRSASPRAPTTSSPSPAAAPSPASASPRPTGRRCPCSAAPTPASPRASAPSPAGPISLFADSVLGNRMVLGVDTDRRPRPRAVPGAQRHAHQREGVDGPVRAAVQPRRDQSRRPGHPRRPRRRRRHEHSSSTSTTLPSGQNLFGTVGDTANGLVVIGKTPVLNADGTFTNASNTINTSPGRRRRPRSASTTRCSTPARARTSPSSRTPSPTSSPARPAAWTRTRPTTPTTSSTPAARWR